MSELNEAEVLAQRMSELIAWAMNETEMPQHEVVGVVYNVLVDFQMQCVMMAHKQKRKGDGRPSIIVPGIQFPPKGPQ